MLVPFDPSAEEPVHASYALLSPPSTGQRRLGAKCAPSGGAGVPSGGGHAAHTRSLFCLKPPQPAHVWSQHRGPPGSASFGQMPAMPMVALQR